MPDYQQHINEQLYQFKVRFIKRRLLEGIIMFLTTALVVYLAVSSLEAIGRFNSIVRGVLLLLFILASGSVFFLRVVRPLLLLFRSDEAIRDEEAARQIGNYYSTIGDKLLNYIQLSTGSFTSNALASASLSQRASELGKYSFPEAITFKPVQKKFLRTALPLLVLVLLLVAVFPRSFIGSTQRIVQFNKPFIPQAPFTFKIAGDLIAFRNEDYLLKVQLDGEALPQEAYFVSKGKRTKMVMAGPGSFELLFPTISAGKTFHIEAAAFSSPEYELKLADRPSLTRFTIALNYPAYLHRPAETLQNIGSFEVPEGTTATWEVVADHTNRALVVFGQDSINIDTEGEQQFSFSRQILNDQAYQLELTNDFSTQHGSIQYEISVIKDQYPQIDIKMLADTLLYSYVAFAGNLSDDHGLQQLSLNYKKNNTQAGVIPIPINKGARTQSLFYQWVLDSLQLELGDQLEFYLQVVDNDAINKYKRTRSEVFYLRLPDKGMAEEQLDDSRESTKKQIDETARDAKELKKNIDKLVEDLKGKKELSWQEEQMLQNLIEQKEKLTEEIKQLQQKNKMLNEQEKQLQSPSPDILEKQEQLQELLDNLMDEETRKLYEELQKLLEEYENTEEVQDMLQKIQNKELNLEQELERALEFFKQIQFEQKLNEASRDLEELIEKQDSLAQQTEDKSKPLDSLAIDQGKLNEEFEKFQEKLRDVKELNQDLKRPNSMQDTSGEEKAAKEAQKEAKENLENNNRNKSKQSQKNSSQQMKAIAKKMEGVQSAMKMQQMQEDLGNLQAILNNLIELSFDQEDLMKAFKRINQSDPVFIQLSQEQLTLKEDSKIINDSLLALASRVMAISSFVTRELNEMNQHMDASIEAIRERKKGDAAVNQQLTMTSINNLALMLDNVMRQMQESMADAMGQGQEDGEQQVPGLSEMQKQLNEQIQELSQSGKSGRELSEELAKLAAEQERIRKALEEAGKKYGGDQGEMDKMMQQMEQTELDLVNKNITRQTLQRQQQILTRMLAAEKSMRERELDSKREAKSATQYEKMLPKAFEDYLRQRENEIELLKTVPPRLMPFFKIEVSDYFNRLKQSSESINN